MFIDIEATDIEETIRFAYALHVQLLPVVHCIRVSSKGYGDVAMFVVNLPNHGK